MSDEVWKEVFVAVVSGLLVSFVTWLLRGTFTLIASHPWLIVIAGVAFAAVIAISRYLWLEKPVTFPDDEGPPEEIYDFDFDEDDYYGVEGEDAEESQDDENWL